MPVAKISLTTKKGVWAMDITTVLLAPLALLGLTVLILVICARGIEAFLRLLWGE